MIGEELVGSKLVDLWVREEGASGILCLLFENGKVLVVYPKTFMGAPDVGWKITPHEIETKAEVGELPEVTLEEMEQAAESMRLAGEQFSIAGREAVRSIRMMKKIMAEAQEEIARGLEIWRAKKQSDG